VIAWGRETRILRQYLAPEIASGALRPDEVAHLASFRARLSRQARALRHGRFRQLDAMRQLDAIQGELAFHNYRMAVRRRPPSEQVGEDLRNRIRTLRGVIDTDRGTTK
jgi:hypothetical protein